MFSRKVVLVPGFMSPSWLLWPLHRHLCSRFPEVVLWDHPHIFSEPYAVAEEFRSWLRTQLGRGNQVALVTHSFGDWVARWAIQSDDVVIEKLLSICPVVDTVPAARLFAAFSQNLIPEVRVMSDGETASACLELPSDVDHLVIWARWDFWIRRRELLPHIETDQRIVNGFHNSVVIQPGVWKQIERFLNSPGRNRPSEPSNSYA